MTFAQIGGRPGKPCLHTEDRAGCWMCSTAKQEEVQPQPDRLAALVAAKH